MKHEIFDDKIIADFMGEETFLVKTAQYPEGFWYLITPIEEPLVPLQYHGSWEWIMPVMDKIESLGYDTQISTISNTLNGVTKITYFVGIQKGNELTVLISYNNSKLGTNIKFEAVRDCVLEFISKYENKKHE